MSVHCVLLIECNSHKLPLMYTVQWFFLYMVYLGQTLSLSNFLFPAMLSKETPYLLSVPVLSSPMAMRILLSASGLSILDTFTLMKSHSKSLYVCLLSLYKTFRTEPGWDVCQSVLYSFLWLNSIPLCRYVLLCLEVDGHSDCFPFSAIITAIIATIAMTFSAGLCLDVFCLLGYTSYTPKSLLTGLYGN